MIARLTVLVAARDEEDAIGRTVTRLREAFPDADVVVADDGSRDATAEVARAAGARVVRLPRRGKGQALTLGEQACGDIGGAARAERQDPFDAAVRPSVGLSLDLCLRVALRT